MILLFLRKLFFYLFLLIYAAATPTVILYALGYTIRPEQKIPWVKTGLVSIETFPSSATVYLNGRKFRDKAPTILRDLLPGKYSIRASLKGYETWEKEVEVFPERAARLEPVVLLPKKQDDHVLFARTFRGFAPEIVDSKILAWEKESLDSLWKMDLIFGKETPVGRKWRGAGELQIKTLHAQKGSDLLVIEMSGNDYVFMELNREKRGIRRLRQWTETIPERIIWDPKNSSQVYFTQKGELSRLDLSRNEFEPALAAGLLGFGVKHGRLYLLDENFRLIATDPRGRNPEPLEEDLELSRKIFSGQAVHDYQIEVFKQDLLQKDLIFFLGKHGALLCNRLPYELVPSGVLGIDYAEKSEEEKILYWTKSEIGMVDFARDPQQIFEKGPGRTVFFSLGKNIRQAVWAYEDTHILFLDGDDLFLLEASGPAPYLVRALTSVAPASPFIYSERGNLLYFLDRTTRRIIKRKLPG